MLDSKNIIVVGNIRDVTVECMEELIFLFDLASNDTTAIGQILPLMSSQMCGT